MVFDYLFNASKFENLWVCFKNLYTFYLLNIQHCSALYLMKRDLLLYYKTGVKEK